MRKLIKLLFVIIAILPCYSCTDFQDANTPYSFSLDRRELSFSSDGKEQSLYIWSATKWEISEMPEWIEWITIQSVNQSNSRFGWWINIYPTVNYGASRTGVIVFSTVLESISVTVVQEEAKPNTKAVESELI